jgi:precorrin-6B methylase 2
VHDKNSDAVESIDPNDERTEATALAGQAEALLNRYERMHTRFIGKGDSKQD